jgi:hypothetical protein
MGADGGAASLSVMLALVASIHVLSAALDQ